MGIIKTSQANEKRKFVINFPRAISEFDKAFQKFPVKRILYNKIFKGRGLEFDTYRIFESNDDASMIDWKATLRSNELLAKSYVEERKLNIYFLLDVSNGMLFGSGEKLKAEYSAEMVASVAHLVSSLGDNIGFIMFNENIIKIFRPSSNRNQFALFKKFLSEPSFYGGNFNIENAIKDILKIVKAEYTIFILISDFINLKKSDEQSLVLLGSKFETIAIMIRDPLDESLPNIPFQFSIQDPQSKRQMILDPTITQKKYKESVIEQKNLVKNIFEKSQIDFIEITTDKSFVNPLISFFNTRVKRRRI